MRRRTSVLAALACFALFAAPVPAQAMAQNAPASVVVDTTPTRFPDWICKIAPRLCA